MAFTALLDACVLYPAPLRDLLISLADTSLFRARWSAEINAEWMNAVLRKRPELRGELRRTVALMNDAIPDCLVTGHETLIETLDLPDGGDRHVLAAAIVGRADVIVTFNLSDFPRHVLAPLNIEAQHPDEFVRDVFDLSESASLGAVRDIRARLKKPPLSPEEYLDVLARQGLPETVAYFRQRIDLI